MTNEIKPMSNPIEPDDGTSDNTNKIDSVDAAKSSKWHLSTRNKVIATAAATALVIGGGTIAAVDVYNHGTTTACADALAQVDSTQAAMQASIANADAQIAAVASTTLPDGQVGTLYTDRAEITAQPATESTPASAAHHSGQQYVDDVTKVKPTDVTLPTTCSSRDDAASITAATKDATAKVAALDTAVSALKADFTVFQNTEMNQLASQAANTAMTGAALTLADAQTAAQAALDAANGDADGYATTEAGAALVVDLQTKLDASKGLDVSATSTTVEEAAIVTASAQTATDTTTVLTDATTALNGSLSAHQGAKATERANAAAQAAAEAQKNAGSTSGSSSKNTGSSNKGTGTSKTSKPPTTGTKTPPKTTGGGDTTQPVAPKGPITPPGGVPDNKGKGDTMCDNGVGGWTTCP